jgi:putative ABC transport system ATP-binding protein
VSAVAELRGVSVVYGGGGSPVHALRAVELELRGHGSTALWGRSGSGKTTLLHVLGGLVEPTSGSVRWSERPSIAYVFQGSHLLPHFTAYENVAFATHGARAGDRPEDLLELVGLGTKLDALPSELSGGEAQRVAIARALGQHPDLLLCDEPTGQLDSDTGARVLDLIDTLRTEVGFGLVVATHDADVAARCGRVVQLADGAIVRSEVSA